VVRRGRLGVFIQDLTPDLAQAMGFAESTGALVTRVLPDTPAEAAGLEAGDLIVAVNSEPVDSSRHLRNMIGAMDPGDTVTIAYIRAGERRTARAKLASQEPSASTPGSADEGAESPLRGVSLGPVPESHPLHGEVEGVLAARVARDSPAARAGLRPGDVIVRVNGTPVSTPEQVQELAREGMAGDSGQVLLYVRRGPGGTFIVIR
jgi:S1-C subfamily serine protease